MLPTILILACSLLPAHWTGTLPAEGLTALEIDNPLGKVTVIAAEEGTINAEADVTEYDAIKDKPWFKSATIELKADGKKGILKLDVDEHFSLTDPPHINFIVRVPKTLVCDITVTASRPLGSYECVNGSITIDATKPWTDGTLTLRAVNGAVNVRLPKGSSATYETDTINGTISLPATVTPSSTSEKKASIIAQTINGNITIAEVESLK
jgi:hypothetical protein